MNRHRRIQKLGRVVPSSCSVADPAAAVNRPGFAAAVTPQ
jgi:hypothetical protein